MEPENAAGNFFAEPKEPVVTLDVPQFMADHPQLLCLSQVRKTDRQENDGPEKAVSCRTDHGIDAADSWPAPESRRQPAHVPGEIDRSCCLERTAKAKSADHQAGETEKHAGCKHSGKQGQVRYLPSCPRRSAGRLQARRHVLDPDKI